MLFRSWHFRVLFLWPVDHFWVEVASTRQIPKTRERATRDSFVRQDVYKRQIFSYDSISGYGAAVARMRSLGVGLAGTPEFDDFVAMLNSRHGLDAMPVVDSLLFCSPAREDASRFMLATVGELGLPAIRMRMEET